ncbi:MAG: signal peptidase I [Deltaproteobacteria bacterium]|nr:MAG: signal peptidase I [Deltaproteobacteria bacterium]
MDGVKVKGKIRENVEAILIAIVLALFIRTFIVQAFKIPSGSMKETLLIGDHILVNKFIYGIKIPFADKILVPLSNPKRDDIIVFKYPEDPKKDFIKRVIGLPGDVIEIRNKQLIINGNVQETPSYAVYKDNKVIPAVFSTRDNFGPFTVPEASLFVMGDNRDNSHDSRFWGVVPRRSVKGKAFMIYWSWNSEAKWVRWKRIGDLLR